MKYQVQDITGQRFGRLTALYYTGRQSKTSHNAIWAFKCDCGNIVERQKPYLKEYPMASCGCYVRERAGNLNKTHGGRNDRLYLVWMDMRRRCLDAKDSNYHNYGGRGITVCEEWLDYANFKKWAYSTGYDDKAKKAGCTLDRIDTNGNYSPQNCRWADPKQQANNKRTNKIVEYNGRSQTARQWADELGLNYGMVIKRLNAGWDVEKAFFKPPRITKVQIVHGQLR